MNLTPGGQGHGITRDPECGAHTYGRSTLARSRSHWARLPPTIAGTPEDAYPCAGRNVTSCHTHPHPTASLTRTDLTPHPSPQILPRSRDPTSLGRSYLARASSQVASRRAALCPLGQCTARARLRARAPRGAPPTTAHAKGARSPSTALTLGPQPRQAASRPTLSEGPVRLTRDGTAAAAPPSPRVRQAESPHCIRSERMLTRRSFDVGTASPTSPRLRRSSGCAGVAGVSGRYGW